MLAHVPAVVGGVHDVGVVELAGLAQRRDHAGNEVIDRLQHGEAAAVDLVDGGELPELEALQFVDQRRLVADRSEEHTSELQSLMRISYAVFCLKKKKKYNHNTQTNK